MDELIKSISIKFEKSTFSFELLKHLSGENYLSIIHHIDALEYNNIKIREKNCLEFINSFNLFLFVKKISKPLYNSVVSFEQEQKVISNYLKGISIKDLELSTRLKEKEIIEILIKNNIEIANEYNYSKKNYVSNRRKKIDKGFINNE
jgi:hypothetical protein